MAPAAPVLVRPMARLSAPRSAPPTVRWSATDAAADCLAPASSCRSRQPPVRPPRLCPTVGQPEPDPNTWTLPTSSGLDRPTHRLTRTSDRVQPAGHASPLFAGRVISLRVPGADVRGAVLCGG